MKLTYRFTVGSPLDASWRAINDVDSVSGCLPGTTVTTTNGDDLEGQVKIKFGLISLVYKGTGRVKSRDAMTHSVVVEAWGRDTRGGGTADAVVTTQLSPTEGGHDVEISVEPTITGRPTQLGPGVITEATDWHIEQYAACLSRKLTGSPDLVHPVQRTSAAEQRASRTAPSEAADSAQQTASRAIPHAVGRARNATPPLVRQYGIPVLSGLAVIFAVLTLLKRRRRKAR